ncbi:MAG: hypothetical protein JRI68_12625 [Deltaproteobacteria bacterium]|nr:hypothetical protein [Deltaproteobacteria bacterium]
MGEISNVLRGVWGQFEEVAKFRAARRLWARIMADRFGAKTDRARALRFHCQTAGMTLLAQQPMVNVVRVATQALAAVLGGCQSLHTNSFDEALGLPTEHAVSLALRTQQVIAHESGLGDFVDPLGGSYAVETLTTRIEEAAEGYLAAIDERGGMVSAIEQGFVQREIQNAAYRYQLDIENKRRIVVGQNKHVADAPPVPVTKIDPAVEESQTTSLLAWRNQRAEGPWGDTLSRLERVARGEDNLVPPIIAAVKAGATVGEISNVLRGVWGQFEEVLTV